MAQSISVQDLRELFRTHSPVRVLDVRRQLDFEAAPRKIPTADWQDPEQTDRWIHAMPPDQDLVVYCVKGGGVSQSVADQLARQQYRVRFLEGGIKAWKEIGGALE